MSVVQGYSDGLLWNYWLRSADLSVVEAGIRAVLGVDGG